MAEKQKTKQNPYSAMKRVILSLALYMAAISNTFSMNWINVELAGQLSDLTTRSLSSPVTVEYEGDYLIIDFYTAIETLVIEVTNSTSDIIYREEVAPQKISTLQIPTKDFAKAPYTLYIINPENGYSLTGEFNKE
ncbi:MAG: DUF3244 domain-containing protein [Clostridium sp.]|nr:DUF3244 domain-containing protein [Clostridium sp.]